mmetsp:Transcript_82478/g.229938  ORF Transcript_82478/g.229938 Transcript_82478/m.229938 type:complete len:267 (+) Transcript_82478:1074-1874(+)
MSRLTVHRRRRCRTRARRRQARGEAEAGQMRADVVDHQSLLLEKPTLLFTSHVRRRDGGGRVVVRLVHQEPRPPEVAHEVKRMVVIRVDWDEELEESAFGDDIGPVPPERLRCSCGKFAWNNAVHHRLLQRQYQVAPASRRREHQPGASFTAECRALPLDPRLGRWSPGAPHQRLDSTLACAIRGFATRRLRGCQRLVQAVFDHVRIGELHPFGDPALENPEVRVSERRWRLAECKHAQEVAKLQWAASREGALHCHLHLCVLYSR